MIPFCTLDSHESVKGSSFHNITSHRRFPRFFFRSDLNLYLIIIISIDLLFEQMAYWFAMKNHITFRIRDHTIHCVTSVNNNWTFQFIRSFFFFCSKKKKFESSWNECKLLHQPKRQDTIITILNWSTATAIHTVRISIVVYLLFYCNFIICLLIYEESLKCSQFHLLLSVWKFDARSQMFWARVPCSIQLDLISIFLKFDVCLARIMFHVLVSFID